MSATFRLTAKKKVTQEELRRLMAQQKAKTITPKIDNPLAKYNETGQLICVLCKSIVRSESVWLVHVNAKQHRDNVAEAKRLKELTNNFTSTVKVKSTKRPGTPPPSVPEKKVKGILKNPLPSSAVIQKPKNDAPVIISHHDEEIKRAPLVVNKTQEVTPIPGSSREEEIKSEVQIEQTAAIPEGFFDDPILDAKVFRRLYPPPICTGAERGGVFSNPSHIREEAYAQQWARNVEYKDPVEEEWEKFQKEIKEEASASAELIAGEQEEATAERQIEEIDEQMRNWSRVLDIELKKEDIKKKKQEVDQMSEDDTGEESDNDVDIDEFLDWRAKKAYR